MIGVGHTPGCFQRADPTPYLRIYGASIMRVIVNPSTGADGSALACVQAAATGGYHVDLTIQWWNPMSVDQIADEFRSMLSIYGPYVWAAAVGNEQELNQGGTTEDGARYAAVWKAVEPIIVTMAPRAIRVAGEVSPWGLPFLSEAVRGGLPGVQALSAHPYQMAGGVTPAAFLAFAAAWHVPMWFTEGLVGPGSWGGAADISLGQMAGAAVAEAWHQ